ncbi:hypothetical protein AB7M41_002323 [Bradyrhizobium diazoefficiens]
MISATERPFCCSTSLLSSTKLQPTFFARDLAERGLAGAAQADQRDAAERRAPRRGCAAAGEHVLGLRDLRGRRLAQEIAKHLPVRRRIGAGQQIFEMRAHRVGDAAEQHDRDIALAAFELRDVALRDS